MGPKKDKGGMVVAILEKMQNHYENGKKANAEYAEDDDGDYQEGYGAAVDEMFSAIESGDKDKYKHALKNFIQLCVDDEGKEGE